MKLIIVFIIAPLTLMATFNFLSCFSINNKSTSFANNKTQNDSTSFADNKAQNDWKVATFKGLIMGRSSQKDALDILGKPDWRGFPEGDSEKTESPEWWMEYNAVKEGNWRGKLTVVSDYKRKIVLAVDFYPEKMSIDDVAKFFGSDYTIRKYNFEPCYDDSDSAPIYEDSKGNLTYLEYREKGIAVYFASDNNPKIVQGISYLSKPLGAKVSQCKN